MRRANNSGAGPQILKMVAGGAFAFSPGAKRVGKPTTLLEGLCGHALSLGAQSIEVEYKAREHTFEPSTYAVVRIEDIRTLARLPRRSHRRL
jgi:hypothetical protein